MAWPDGISDPHCGSNNLQGYSRGAWWDHTHPPVLPWVWEAYIWEVRKGPLMLEARRVSTRKREVAFPFSLSCWGPMDNQPLRPSEMTSIHGKAVAAPASNLFMWHGK